MGKLIFFGILAFLAYWLLRNSGRKSAAARRPKPEPQAQLMVCCAQCGLNLPEIESLQADGQHYCCEQHRGLGPLQPNRR